jgi:hypothetical protein
MSSSPSVGDNNFLLLLFSLHGESPLGNEVSNSADKVIVLHGNGAFTSSGLGNIGLSVVILGNGAFTSSGLGNIGLSVVILGNGAFTSSGLGNIGLNVVILSNIAFTSSGLGNIGLSVVILGNIAFTSSGLNVVILGNIAFNSRGLGIGGLTSNAFVGFFVIFVIFFGLNAFGDNFSILKVGFSLISTNDLTILNIVLVSDHNGGLLLGDTESLGHGLVDHLADSAGVVAVESLEGNSGSSAENGGSSSEHL